MLFGESFITFTYTCIGVIISQYIVIWTCHNKLYTLYFLCFSDFSLCLFCLFYFLSCKVCVCYICVTVLKVYWCWVIPLGLFFLFFEKSLHFNNAVWLIDFQTLQYFRCFYPGIQMDMLYYQNHAYQIFCSFHLSIIYVNYMYLEILYTIALCAYSKTCYYDHLYIKTKFWLKAVFYFSFIFSISMNIHMKSMFLRSHKCSFLQDLLY